MTVDLSEGSVEKHWEGRSKEIRDVLKSMESAEHWVADKDPEVLAAIEEWLSKLDEDLIDDLSDSPEDLHFIHGMMSSSRAMILINLLENEEPGITTDLLYSAIHEIDKNGDKAEFERVFRDRIVCLYRLNLLGRVFSKERIESVKTSVTNAVAEYGCLYEKE